MEVEEYIVCTGDAVHGKMYMKNKTKHDCLLSASV